MDGETGAGHVEVRLARARALVLDAATDAALTADPMTLLGDALQALGRAVSVSDAAAAPGASAATRESALGDLAAGAAPLLLLAAEHAGEAPREVLTRVAAHRGAALHAMARPGHDLELVLAAGLGHAVSLLGAVVRSRPGSGADGVVEIALGHLLGAMAAVAPYVGTGPSSSASCASSGSSSG